MRPAILLVFALLASPPASAQPACPLDANGDLLLTSQAEIDAASACVRVLGNLVVQEDQPGEIVNLDGLRSIVSVDSALAVAANTALTGLDGLEAVTSVGGHVVIDGNRRLASISGLRSLASVGGSLFITSNVDFSSFAPSGPMVGEDVRCSRAERLGSEWHTWVGRRRSRRELQPSSHFTRRARVDRRRLGATSSYSTTNHSTR